MARSAVPGGATTRSGAAATVAARTATRGTDRDPTAAGRFAYRLRQRGGRLAANAVTPSIMSSLIISSSTADDVCVTASMTSGMPLVSAMTRSDSRTEVGDPSRISAASARAPSSARPAGYPVDEAVAECLGRGDAAAGEDHLGRDLGRDGAGQPHEAACAGDQADLDLAERELSGGVGDDEVAGESDLAAAAHRVPVDRGDDRLGHVAAAGQAAKPFFGTHMGLPDAE